MNTNGYIPRDEVFSNLDVYAGYLMLDGGAVIQSTGMLELLNDSDAGIAVEKGVDGVVQLLGSVYMDHETEDEPLLGVDAQGRVVTDGGSIRRTVRDIEERLARQETPELQTVDWSSAVLAVSCVFTPNDNGFDLSPPDAGPLAVNDVLHTGTGWALVTTVDDDTLQLVPIDGSALPIGSFSVSEVLRGVAIRPNVRLMELTGTVSPGSQAQYPMVLPLAKEHGTLGNLALKVVNVTTGGGEVVLYTRPGDTMDKAATSMSLGSRALASDSSVSVSLLSNLNDTWYISA